MCVREEICGLECDEIRKITCMDRVTKEQAKIYRLIETRCNNCYSRTVKARYNKKETRLCTTCNNIRREQLKGAIN